MRDRLVTVIRPCVAFALVAPLLGAATARGAGEESAALRIASVKVRTTKPGGAAWDAGGGAPDLKVSIEKRARPAGEKFTTKVIRDTFEAKYHVTTIKVKDGDEVEITVTDEDAAGDDQIGRLRKRLTAKMFREGEAEWSFGEVLSLTLEFVD